MKPCLVEKQTTDSTGFYWIRVEDGLPKRSGEYMTFSPSQTVLGQDFGARITTLRFTGSRWISSFTCREEGGRVTHWMPLPEPPVSQAALPRSEPLVKTERSKTDEH